MCDLHTDALELAMCVETMFQWAKLGRVMILCNVPMVKLTGWSNEVEFGIAAQITISSGVLDVSDLQAKT
jgi:hypothetical protein